MCQRRSSRASKMFGPGTCGRIFTLSGDSWFRMRTAAPAAFLLKLSMDISGPPTIPSPIWLLCSPKIGALATRECR